MVNSRNNLYSLLFIACIAGYIWLFFGLRNFRTENKSVEVCLIKHVTNIPCPSCGSTRSIMYLTEGNFIEALRINPMGYIVLIIMILAPIWIVFDLTTKRKTFFEFYKKIEIYLSRPKYSIPLILMVIFNWIWNITKRL